MQKQSVQPDDLAYCCESDCKQPIRIITSVMQQYKDHNGHKIEVISALRAELLQIDDNKNPLKVPTINNKEDIITLIDNGINSLNELFQQTMLDLSKKLKSFVNDNLVSLKTIQLLFKAVLDDNREDINKYQSELLYLKKDFKYFEEQEHFSKDVVQQLQKIFELSKDKIIELNNVVLMQPTAQISPLINPEADLLKWSTVNKNQSTSINEQSVMNNDIDGHNTVLIETLLTFQQVKTITLKITKNSQECFIQICDLKVVKVKCPDFHDIYRNDNGAYSHLNTGCNYTKHIPEIYGTDTYGQGEASSFTFTAGDILDLIWNGPLKTFTTVKKSTGERFEFEVNFSAEAQIYFGVSMHQDCSVEIV